jgi:hypothetical protein
VRGCADQLTVARLVPGWVRAECAGGHAEGDGVRVGMGGKAIGMPFGQRFEQRFEERFGANWNASRPRVHSTGHAARQSLGRLRPRPASVDKRYCGWSVSQSAAMRRSGRTRHWDRGARASHLHLEHMNRTVKNRIR